MKSSCKHLCLCLQINENLVKNGEIWKAKLLEIEERYALIPFSFPRVMCFFVSQNNQYMVVRCLISNKTKCPELLLQCVRPFQAYFFSLLCNCDAMNPDCLNLSSCKFSPEVCRLTGDDVLFSREKKTLKLNNDRLTGLEKQVTLYFALFLLFFWGLMVLWGVVGV